jgi:pyruvate/2-oxoglutarate dehydrogenase complex dihydrolipoamide acyltransferase (E2) component
MVQEINTIVLPALGEGIEKATVVTWLVQVGDCLKKDDEILELVTDKASFNVTSDRAGIVKKILVAAGHEVRIGEPLVLIQPSV